MRLPGLPLLALTIAACAGPLAYRADAGAPAIRHLAPERIAVDLEIAVRGGGAAARILGIDWEVRVDGLAVGVGSTAVEEVVAARGETLLRLPLSLDTGADFPAGVGTVLARGRTVPVEVRGAVRVRDRDGDIHLLPFASAAPARHGQELPVSPPGMRLSP